MRLRFNFINITLTIIITLTVYHDERDIEVERLTLIQLGIFKKKIFPVPVSDLFHFWKVRRGHRLTFLNQMLIVKHFR